jgi:hypothetical protein
MDMDYIASEEGVDTVALQDQHPELFNVHTTKAGLSIWTLRPEVSAAIRAPIDAALQNWIAARERFEATGDHDDRTAAVAAAFEYAKALGCCAQTRTNA